MLTNEAARIELRLERMSDYIQALNGRRPSPAAVRTAMGVQPRFLHSAFQSMRERLGDIDTYLDQALGIDHGRRARIAEHLTAEAA